jgi:hypothetical protein
MGAARGKEGLAAQAIAATDAARFLLAMEPLKHKPLISVFGPLYCCPLCDAPIDVT